MDYRTELETLLGLKTVNYKYGLSKDELFHEAIANDRGRVRKDGPSNEQKAFATKLGVSGKDLEMLEAPQWPLPAA